MDNSNNKNVIFFSIIIFMLSVGLAFGGGSGYFEDSGQVLGSARSVAVAIGDINGDGQLDAFAANYSQVNAVWINNNGTFSQASQPNFVTPANHTGVALGHLNKDATLDAIVTIRNGIGVNSGLKVLFNTGGVYSVHQTFGGVARYEGVALGDLDLDGDLDAFIITDGQGNRVWKNDGTGTFVNTNQVLGSDETVDVALADVDDDGDLDAIVANSSDGNRIWLNNGLGYFTTSSSAIGGFNSLSVATGDVDNDGDVDLLFGTEGEGTRLWMNEGSLVFIDSGQTLGTYFYTNDVALKDVDDDSDLDAFIINDGESSRLWVNEGDGIFYDSNVPYLVNPTLGPKQSEAIGFADFDTDGDVDAFVANYEDGNNVLLNQGIVGSGQFRTGAKTVQSFNSWAMASGDLDNDGDNDAFVVNFNQPSAVFLNDGEGNLTYTGQQLVNTFSYGVALGDLNKDGAIDAFVVNGGMPNKVWFNDNDGSGRFSDSLQALGNELSYAVALGDFDKDGDLDAFVVNGLGQPDELWTNDGLGHFTLKSLIGSESGFAVAVGDINKDGYLDAVVVNPDDKNIKVWINNPANPGVFTDNGDVLDGNNGRDVGLGDLDLDGDLDMFVAYNGLNKVFKNINGHFHNLNQGIINGQLDLDSQGVALCDWNLDGNLDAFVGNFKKPDEVWLNDGNGIFNLGDSFGESKSMDVDCSDFDGDGKVDAYVANFAEQDIIWLNRSTGNKDDGDDGNGKADLEITKISTPNPVVLNGTLTYTVTLKNNGPDYAYQVRLTDTLPEGVNLVNYTGPNCSLNIGSIICQVGTMAPQQVATLTIVVTVTDYYQEGDVIKNNASYLSANEDPVSTNNSEEEETTVTLQQYTLTVNVGGTSQGTVTSNPAGISCTNANSPCAHDYGDGQVVKLTPTWNATTTMFGQWIGCDSVDANKVCTVILTSNRSVTATLALLQYQVSASTTPEPGGVIQATGINCGNGNQDCTENYNYDSVITFTATAANGYRFTGWAGDCFSSGSNPTCVLQINGAKNVVANFIKQSTVSVQVANENDCTGYVTSAPVGITCGTGQNPGDCSENYDNGQNILLTPGVSSGIVVFAGWTGGACAGQSNNCLITSLQANTQELASFECVKKTVTISISGLGKGTVTSAPAGINCDNIPDNQACSAGFKINSQVVLTATPQPNSYFISWDGCASATNVCTIASLANDRTIGAIFGNNPILTVNVNADTGTGHVQSSVPNSTDIDCGVNSANKCSKSYPLNTSVQLVVVAAAVDSYFVGWENCNNVVNNVCTVTMDQSKTVNAKFKRYPLLTVDVDNGTGFGQVLGNVVGLYGTGINCDNYPGGSRYCAEAYNTNPQVTLTATPRSDSIFISWTGCDSINGSNQCVVSVNTDKNVFAVFNLKKTLTVNTLGGAGTCRVYSVIDSGASVNCTGICTKDYSVNASVLLRVEPDANSYFVSWSNCDSPNGNDCTMTMNADKTLLATCALKPQLNIIINGLGAVNGPGIACVNGQGDCLETYNPNTIVNLTATEDATTDLVSWAGCNSSSVVNKTCSVTMDVAKSVTAVFQPKPVLTVAKIGSPPANGTISSVNVGGINCDLNNTDCSNSYSAGTTVILQCIPNSDSYLSANPWNGCTTIINNNCSVTVNNNTQVDCTLLAYPQVSIQSEGTGAGTVTGNGINCANNTGDCSERYNPATEIPTTFIATADANSTFIGWQGTCDSVNGTSCTINTLTSDRVVKPKFDLKPKLTVDKTGAGTVTSTPAGITCGATCVGFFDVGTNITLNITADQGATIESITGCDSSNGQGGTIGTCTVNNLTADRTVTIVFMQAKLTVVTNGAGSVTSQPTGINCGNGAGDCEEIYQSNTPVTLNATAGTGLMVSSITGCDAGTSQGVGTPTASCVVTMVSNKTVTFTFTQPTLTVTPTGTGTVVSQPAGINCPDTSCTAPFNYNQAVVITATAGAGEVVASMTGCDTGTEQGIGTSQATCTVSTNGNKPVTVLFRLPRLTVAKTGTGTGTVVSEPSGITCGGTCNASFNFNQSVTLTATSDAGYVVSNWIGCDSSTQGVAVGTCTVSMNSDRNVTAVFGDAVQLTIVVNGPGFGSARSSNPILNCTRGENDLDPTTCTYAVLKNATIQMNAQTAANSRYVDGSWSGCDIEAGEQCDVYMTTNKTLSLQFAINPKLTLEITGVSGAIGRVLSAPDGINCTSTAANTNDPYNPMICIGYFNPGTAVTLTADGAGTDSTVKEWIGCNTVNGNICTVNFASDRTIKVVMAPKATLTVDNLAGTSECYVTSQPAGINCGAGNTTCAADYSTGASVELTAVPIESNTPPHIGFSGWTGCDTVSYNVCYVNMTGARNVAANCSFQAKVTIKKTDNLPSLIDSIPPKQVVNDPNGIYCDQNCTEQSGYFDIGATVTLKVKPGVLTGFNNWGGDKCVNEKQRYCSFEMGNTDINITASNVAEPRLLISFDGVGTFLNYYAAGVFTGTWSAVWAYSYTGITGLFDNNGIHDAVISLYPHGLYMQSNLDGGWTAILPYVFADYTNPNNYPVGTLISTDLDGNGINELALDAFDYNNGVPVSRGIMLRHENGTWEDLDARNPVVMATGDLDNDGREELIASFSNGGGLWAYHAEITPEEDRWQSIDNRSPVALTVAYLNDNDKLDIIAGFGNSVEVLIDPNFDGNDQWDTIASHTAQQLVALDIDNNGQMDIAIDGGAVGLTVYRNMQVTDVLLAGASPVVFSAIDMDGNGVKELVVSWPPAYVYDWQTRSWLAFVTSNSTTNAPFWVEFPDAIPGIGKIGSAKLSTTNKTSKLAVEKTGTGLGVVKSVDGAIDCGNQCTGQYSSETKVTLQAVPVGNSTFIGWTGASCLENASSNLICTVSVDDYIKITAQFTASQAMVMDFPTVQAATKTWLLEGFNDSTNQFSWQGYLSLSANLLSTGSFNDNPIKDVVVDFGAGYGIYVVYDGTVTNYKHVTPKSALVIESIDLNNNKIDDIVADFGLTERISVIYDADINTATQISAKSSQGIVGADVNGDGKNELVVDFGQDGIQIWDGAQWQKIDSRDPKLLVAADIDGNSSSEVVAAFANVGVEVWNNQTWTSLDTKTPNLLLKGDVDNDKMDELIADFGQNGVALWNDNAWQKLTVTAPVKMALTHLNADDKLDLVADLGPGKGLYAYLGLTQSMQILTLSPQNMVSYFE